MYKQPPGSKTAMLSDSDSDTDDLHTLTVNEHYAKAFEYKKEREELTKLKEKYGSDYSHSGASDVDASEESEDTEEDSDGEELTPAVDAAILRTLALIKKRDPAIYEDGRRVFDEERTRTQKKAPAARAKPKENSKPLTIRQAALASALAEGDLHSRTPTPEPHPLTHTEEQALLRSETRAAFHGAIDSEAQGDDGDLLIPRSRARDEVELEEQEYKSFLEREVGEDIRDLVTVETNGATTATGKHVEGHDNTLESKKKKKGKKEREMDKNQGNDVAQNVNSRNKNSKQETDHEFLINYIFNRGWIDHSNRRLPTYNEIVQSSSNQSKRKLTESQADSDDDNADQNSNNDQDALLSDEDSFDDLADAFETSYNFRFEEPNGALIATFPRNVSSARRESSTRKDARARRKERQAAEKETLLETRRAEIRKERALVEAAVADEDEENLAIRTDALDNKKSKKQQRREEIARLKALKANELQRKLERVSSEGGLGGLGDEALAHLDLDADWDPMKHDAQMAELYDAGDNIVDDRDTEKPFWNDDINIDDIEPSASSISKAESKKKKKEKKKNRAADEDVGVDVDEMDADLHTGADDWDDGEEWMGTEEERKRKVDAYMDEVVNRLGFSGIASHMPTRFHYVSTTSENYGLTPAEILLATDAELNTYVGLKKLAPYRVDKGGKVKKNWDPKRVERLKEFREGLHSRMGSKYEGSWSLVGGTNSRNRATEMQGEKKKRKGKKERAKLKGMQGERDGGGDDDQLEVADKLEKRRRDSDVASQPPESDPGEAEAYAEDGARRKRRRRRHKKGSNGGAIDVS